MNDVEIIDRNTDLVFSPDDGGFYFQLYLRDKDCNTKTSQMFDTQGEALQAYKENRIVWGG